MRRILFAWEVGSGLGHLARLIPIARRFQQRGDHVELAVRDPQALVATTRERLLPSRPAPHLTPDRRALPVSLNYGDTLRRNGYLDPPAVQRLIEQWIALIDEVRPDLVVLEHAPGALLAAARRGLPRIVIGSGFSVPPLVTPQPTIQPWFDVTDEVLARREQALLSAINPALVGLGGSPLASVAGMFDGAERCICTWPDLDHYDGRPTDEFIGPVSDVDGGDVPWPEGDGPRVFFYGRNSRVMDVLEIAVARGCRIVAFLRSRQAPAGLPLHVTWLTVPASLEALAASADLVVCDAPGTATQFLRHGVPAMLLPFQLEQELWAYRVTAKGLARSIGNFSRGGALHLAEAFDEALTSSALRSRVGAFAATDQTRDSRESLTRLMDRCEALLM